MLSSFRLGVVARPLDGHENYQNRISIPYLTPSGVVSMRFRTVGDPGERAKLLGLPGDITRLYNTVALLKSSDIYVTEGETDCIAATQAGLSAVGLPGATTWTKDISRVFGRIFLNRRVTVLADNDDVGEGMEFAKDIYRTLGGCRIVLMDKGHDVSSFIQTFGEKALYDKVTR